MVDTLSYVVRTICPRSLVRLYTATYFTNMDKTSLTYSTIRQFFYLIMIDVVLTYYCFHPSIAHIFILSLIWIRSPMSAIKGNTFLYSFLAACCVFDLFNFLYPFVHFTSRAARNNHYNMVLILNGSWECCAHIFCKSDISIYWRHLVTSKESRQILNSF